MNYIVSLVILIIISTLPNLGFAQTIANFSQVGDQVSLISPILQKISDKGTYLVTVKSGQSSISTGLNMEIVFLNKTSPYLNAAPPNAESNLSSTEYNKSSGLVVPSVVERTVPVKSYDIVIYSNDSKELWKKVNQTTQGGRAPQTIMLKDYDIGDITISIKNIVPDPALANILNQQEVNNTNHLNLNQSQTKKSPSDSVQFQTKILII
ncbi:MAG: hypothetical protein ACRD93_02155 [Nitrososphaeraceae archaeon]